MDYVEGQTLRDLIDSGAKLSRKVIFDLFTQLITALKQIHSVGLVHRDIKPENLFVCSKTGKLKVGDFGLAKCLNTPTDQFKAGRDIGGTPMYLSPEQK